MDKKVLSCAIEEEEAEQPQNARKSDAEAYKADASSSESDPGPEEKIKPECEKDLDSEFENTVCCACKRLELIIASGTSAGAAIYAAISSLLAALGLTAAGPVAGGAFATAQAVVGNIGAGSAMAWLQSFAMGGTLLSPVGIAAGGGAAATYFFNQYCQEYKECDCQCEDEPAGEEDGAEDFQDT